MDRKTTKTRTARPSPPRRRAKGAPSVAADALRGWPAAKPVAATGAACGTCRGNGDLSSQLNAPGGPAATEAAAAAAVGAAAGNAPDGPAAAAA
jgi:hypothetical protein